MTITEVNLQDEVDLEKAIPCEEEDDCPNPAEWREHHKIGCGSVICTPHKNLLLTKIHLWKLMAPVLQQPVQCMKCHDLVDPSDIEVVPL